MKLSPVIPCAPRHLPAILEIWNEAILNTTVVYDYQPRTPAMVERWYEERLAANFPILGVESDTGALVGFATYGPFRAFPAYKYTVEHSVYVDKSRRSHGGGQNFDVCVDQRGGEARPARHDRGDRHGKTKAASVFIAPSVLNLAGRSGRRRSNSAAGSMSASTSSRCTRRKCRRMVKLESRVPPRPSKLILPC